MPSGGWSAPYRGASHLLDAPFLSTCILPGVDVSSGLSIICVPGERSLSLLVRMPHSLAREPEAAESYP